MSELGKWARQTPQGLIAEPRDEAELIEVLHVLADRKAVIGRDVTLSRARLTMLGAIDSKSMTLRVGAGVVLADLEKKLIANGLSLGPLSPAAMAMTLGDFLEGRYAGLRPVHGGRLEPLCGALVALTSEGRRFETSRAPRSAAGPDLSALVLGGEGRLALVTEGVVRCVEWTGRQTHAAWQFTSFDALKLALQESLALGALPWDAIVESTVLQVRLAGSLGSIERDRDVIHRVALRHGAAATEPNLKSLEGEHVESEFNWADLKSHASKFELHRLSLTSALCRGGEGRGEGKWPALSQSFRSLDASQTLGDPT